VSANLPHNQTELERLLADRLTADRSLSFRDFMDAALYHPQFGYYSTPRPKIGPRGDFYTASNVHEVFGSVLAEALSRLCVDTGPDSGGEFNIVEFGAGTGQLAADILDRISDFNQSLSEMLVYTIIERSPVMIDEQRRRFGQTRCNVRWNDLDHLHSFRGVVLSNEFVDALPVHRVRMHEGKLEEQYVKLAAHSGSEPGPLKLFWSDRVRKGIPEFIQMAGADLADGQVVEVNLDAIEWLTRIGGLLRAGFVMTIDYGDHVEQLWDNGRREGTLRGFRRHRLVDSILDVPGEQDITASVNFTSLEKYGERAGLDTVSYERQTDFLIRNGFLDKLGEIADVKQRLAAKNLIVPGGASDNFRVLVQRKSRK